MGKKKIDLLPLADAMAAVREMNPKSFVDYLDRLVEFPGLPANPKKAYLDSYPGWEAYTSGLTKPYQTIEEAKAAVSALGIKSRAEYNARRYEDRRLPLAPTKFYGEAYKGHEDFYGKNSGFYDSLKDASLAAISLGVTTSREYNKAFSKDSRLPRCPYKIYRNEWVGWNLFLGKVDGEAWDTKYLSFDEFEVACRQMGIKNKIDYLERYKENPKFPMDPDVLYKAHWPGWRALCGKSTYRIKCDSWQEAKEIAAQYRFDSWKDYTERYVVDIRLPKNPAYKFRDQGFPGWKEFLLLDNIRSIEDLKCAVRVLGIQSSKEYREAVKSSPQLPPFPMEKFKKDWVSWEDTLGFPKYYSYQELSEIAQSHGCTSIKEYRALVKSRKDYRMPSNPHYIYEEWKNAYEFFGRDRPYTLDFIEESTAGWLPSVKRWLHKTKSGARKETSVCRFLRHYISPNSLGATPSEFLMMSGVDVRPFKELLDGQASQQSGRTLLLHVNEFLNDVLKYELTIEDEETGELVRVSNASNPLAYLEHSVSGNDNGRPGESTKPALAYQYVESAKRWIVSNSAKCFSDLKHLHDFDADYFEVEPSVIDPLDPDCVYKISDGKYYIWYPGFWMHTYSLVSIPARGRQIAYNDSGEADEYIADLIDGELKWVKNTGKLSNYISVSNNFLKARRINKGFIQKTESGWAMHFTSNKTGFGGSGYIVDWAPEELVYWMVKLRKWQEKYNPINRAFPWRECTRTNLNEAQREIKGENCFLFRGFREEEPPAYSARSTERLAAALYYSQPKDLILAIFREGGSRSTISRYESQYTPHSMRVSLITAYVMEFGLPIEVIMKLAGHSSIVMSIYYVKIGGVALRRRMEMVEKRALIEETYAAQDMIEQGRVNELRHKLVATSQQALEVLQSGYSGSTLVRDYGLCPYAAGRCEDGGGLVGATQVRHPAPNGYLGMQNCPRCRHFITGPMFLGGLVSLWNEISLRMVFLSENYQSLEVKLAELKHYSQSLEEKQYDAEQSGHSFDVLPLRKSQIEIRRLQSELESVAKKMDMFLCDMQSLTRHINDCRSVMEPIETSQEVDDCQLVLVVQEGQEVVTDIENTSLFQQLYEVCENATIYQSASADFALPRRSLMIDKMALINGLRPTMCRLSDKEQLVLGNQITKFFLSRVKGWKRLDDLMDGKLSLQDLKGEERITHAEIQQLLDSKPLSLGELLPGWIRDAENEIASRVDNLTRTKAIAAGGEASAGTSIVNQDVSNVS